jgi:hypothetical protein
MSGQLLQRSSDVHVDDVVEPFRVWPGLREDLREPRPGGKTHRPRDGDLGVRVGGLCCVVAGTQQLGVVGCGARERPPAVGLVEDLESVDDAARVRNDP